MSKSRLLQNQKEDRKRQEETAKTMAPPELALEAAPLQAKMGQGIERQSEGSTSKSALPADVQQQMEGSLGADFSNVEIHKDSEKAESIGAKAYTQGDQVHFAKGQFDAQSTSGKELIGHELAHVVQQRSGKVAPTGNVGGMALNDNSSLENEADQMGAKAARGEKGSTTQLKASSAASTAAAPVQRFKMDSGDIARYPKFAEFVRTQLSKAHNDARISKYLNHYGTNEGETARDIPADMQWGSGPLIKPYSLPKNANSYRSGQDSDVLRVRRRDIQDYEKNDDSRAKFHELLLESSVLNGYTQYLDDQDGKDFWGKEGTKFEEKSYGRDVNNVWTAKDARRARFGEGQYTVKVVGKSASFGQRVKIWNAETGNGQHIAEPGNEIAVTGKKFPRWLLQIEHNKEGNDARKGWTKSNQIVTQECDNKWLIRSEDWIDHDNNDLMVVVEKKPDAGPRPA